MSAVRSVHKKFSVDMFKGSPPLADRMANSQSVCVGGVP